MSPNLQIGADSPTAFPQLSANRSQFNINAPTANGVIRNSVAQPRPQTVHENPHSIRWFYGAGLLFPLVKARTTGMQTGLVPQGTLVAFEDFSLPIDNPSLEEGADVTIVSEITAFEAANNALTELSGRGGLLIDALTGIEDQEMLQRLFEIVHPPFADIEHECPEKLTICPTCRLAFLDAEFINERIDELAEMNGVNPLLAGAVANVLRQANQQLLNAYQNDWNTIRQELEQSKTGKQGALRILFPEHHYVRQCLHADSPENAQAQVAAGYGKEVAQAMQQNALVQAETIGAALKEVSSTGNDRMAAVLENLAASQAQTNQLIAVLLQNQQQAAKAETLDAAAPIVANAQTEATAPSTATGAGAKPSNRK